VIDPQFLNTPQVEFDSLAKEIGVELLLKIETLNPIRSFKGRGASYLTSCMRDSRALVAASAGNFGQGLAHAGRTRGISVTVFAAETANPLKVARMRDFGADVVLVGRDFDEAKSAARDFAAEQDARFVEDGRDSEIAEGAGTIARNCCNRNARRTQFSFRSEMKR
jgi:threonine dehydratase